MLRSIALMTALMMLAISTPVWADDAPPCTTTVTVSFPPRLPWYNFTITNQYEDYGITFSGTDRDTNRTRQGSFYNPGRIDFKEPVCGATLLVRDHSPLEQLHTLSGMNQSGIEVAFASVRDDGSESMPSQLTVNAGWRTISAIAYNAVPRDRTQLLEVQYTR